MKKQRIPMIAILAITFTSCNNEVEEITSQTNDPIVVTYQFKNLAKTTINWTAYKTEEKIGVGGQFIEFSCSSGQKTGTIAELLKGLSFDINTASTNTSNEKRDNKIIHSFFGSMQDSSHITGNVISTNGDDAKGSCNINLNMNGVEHTLELNYSNTNDTLLLSGEMDCIDWNASEALHALNEVCSVAHKGDGKESVTWPTVDISIATPIITVNK